MIELPQNSLKGGFKNSRMKRTTKLFKIFKWAIIILPILILVSIFLANKTIEKTTKGKTFGSVNEIPHNKVGLLLGTSKHLSNGSNNLYFTLRIKATYELYKNHKIDYLVISGDNSSKGYNEPEDMKIDLVMLGIPDSVIYLDYAGFRTYDSVIRMNKIFGQNSFTIISQHFHNERAVYLASALKLNAIGFDAKDVSKYFGFKTKVREQFARVKMFLDLASSKDPKFLGEKVMIR